MINRERIDAIKRDTDIKAYIESRGIPLNKNGNGYFGLCPFHDDKSPSLSVNCKENLWQCFGCGKGGDVVRFVELFDKVNFKEAVKRLSDGHNQAPQSKKQPALDEDNQPSSPRRPNLRQYLERVVEIYANNFIQKAPAKAYLTGRGITDAGLFTKHTAGYCNGTLNEILPKNGGIREGLKDLGVLLKDGSERFKNCVVFPIYDVEGQVITLYGRSISPASNKKHLFLPKRPTGLWNHTLLKTYPEIILTESVIDALSVQMAGFDNVISIQGANGLTERLIMDFGIYRVNRIILLMDGDEPGIAASKRLKEKLHEFKVEIKTLPDGHDPNSFLLAFGAEALSRFLQTPADSQKNEPAQKTEGVELLPDGFAVTFGLRKYHIIGLEKGSRKLKATVRIDHGGKLHVDTLDFYSARSRRILAQDICRIFDEMPETIESDITRLMLECEQAVSQPVEPEPADPAEALSQADRKEAEAFGTSKDLIETILKDYESCGLVGEKANKLLGYVVMTSRKREKPLALLILASSGAGKSALQDAIISFCPPEDLVKVTNLSGKALFYKDEMSLKHKVLALEEGDGAEDAAYAIRSLISSGVLITEATVKDLTTGKLTTMENKVEGPTAVFFTTTNPEADPETKSRFFVTGIDESREQTRKILDFQRRKHMNDDLIESLEIKAIQKRHWNFQRLLKPYAVKNPFSDQLTYEDDRLQGRRDQPKYLNLIKSVAFLRQMQKEVKHEVSQGQKIAYIEADLEDIRIANYLANEILGQSLDEMSLPGRALLLLLDEMVEEIAQDRDIPRTKIEFIRRDVREYTGWSNYRVHTHLKELVNLEYVLVESGKNGSQYRYRLAYEGQGKNGERFLLGLKDIKSIKKKTNL